MEGYEQLRAFYENEGEEELRLAEDGEQYLEFLTATRYLDRFLPPGAAVLDSCAGSGVYAFHLAGKGRRVTAGDIVPRNVEVMRAKQATSPPLEALYEGDALDLGRFADGAFDAVLCMGALYHMSSPADRRRAVAESIRVLAPGGVAAFTYMNRYAVIMNNVRGSLDNIDEVIAFAREGREGIFYASTPEEAERLTAEQGLETIAHVALDGMAWFLHGTAGLLDKEGFLRWRRYHFEVCEVASLLGCSYHNLLLCRKRA